MRPKRTLEIMSEWVVLVEFMYATLAGIQVGNTHMIPMPDRAMCQQVAADLQALAVEGTNWGRWEALRATCIHAAEM